MMAVMVIVAGVAAMASAAGLRPARRRLFRRIH
jgi:hypothetical protein